MEKRKKLMIATVVMIAIVLLIMAFTIIGMQGSYIQLCGRHCLENMNEKAVVTSRFMIMSCNCTSPMVLP